MGNTEETARLRSELGALKIDSVASNHLGKAGYAFLAETKAADPWDTPSGAAQMFNLLRKGTTIGEVNQARIGAVLTMLGQSSDPVAEIEKWAGSQNGNHAAPVPEPEPARELPPELVVSEETKQALAGAFGQVKLLYEQKKTELTRKEEELTGLRAEVRQMEGILKAAGIIPRAPWGRNKKKEEKPKPKGTHISDETAAEIFGKLREYLVAAEPALPDIPGSFTRPQIEKALGIHHSQVGSAVERWREQGLVRAAGVVRAGKSNQKTNVFVVEA